jgi:hypothetical protein
VRRRDVTPPTDHRKTYDVRPQQRADPSVPRVPSVPGQRPSTRQCGSHSDERGARPGRRHVTPSRRRPGTRGSGGIRPDDCTTPPSARTPESHIGQTAGQQDASTLVAG